MKPIHTKYDSAETFVFPEAITLKVLLSGKHTNGNQAVFEDIVDGEMHEFKPGDVAFIPRGTVHAFKNIGNKPGRLRYIFSPANTIEDMFREFYEALGEGNLTQEKMTEISLKHGQEFVGPPL